MITCLPALGQQQLIVEDAKGLVMAAVSKKAKRLPGLFLEGGTVEGGRCMSFDVLWANPGPGSVHVDFYTVDVKTGALRRGVLDQTVTTPAAAAIQRALRKRRGITAAEYRRAVERRVCSDR